MWGRVAEGILFIGIGVGILLYFAFVHGDPLSTTGYRATRTPVFGVLVGVASLLFGAALVLDVGPDWLLED
ncbi:hypothetical protein [Natrarchaeobaculum sulfurireducens]|uniref:Uncharacterized protein n=1 Tax=Natrarchaeobaculum sulfurireducens TaxID=2044521 RepID=A0A346PAV4_9EURY|nr:hypothetical protein [Natrarchaeobaculum sulfurireducens]AXR76649.1 hypothetical protein AArc1_0305 [Natrarchaeobaculum sulfurireducens]AXR80319.1 hypothetical protein AArcMg_0296 [Natrarchaeobaculum sulfurireducens]